MKAGCAGQILCGTLNHQAIVAAAVATQLILSDCLNVFISTHGLSRCGGIEQAQQLQLFLSRQE